MKCSWSLFFAQDVHEEAVSEVLSRALLLRDRGRPTVFFADREMRSTRRYIYVADVGVVGSSSRVVAERTEEVMEYF